MCESSCAEWFVSGESLFTSKRRMGANLSTLIEGAAHPRSGGRHHSVDFSEGRSICCSSVVLSAEEGSQSLRSVDVVIH